MGRLLVLPAHYAACEAATALASAYVASRRGRPAIRWALWTLALGGLPLVLLLIIDLFSLPKARGGTRHRCCDNLTWTPVADFGHAGGTDLDLGRCAACGAYLMAVGYAGSTTYVVVSPEKAQRFLSLQGTPELAKALKRWVE
jgi:hypothetical protein